MPSLSEDGEGSTSGEEAVKSIWKDRRGKECDTSEKTRRVNWGISAALDASGIMHKPERRGRDSDVAIVSDEAGGQNNRWRSQGPLGRCVVSEAVSAAGRKFDYGIQRERNRSPLWQRISGASREGRC